MSTLIGTLAITFLAWHAGLVLFGLFLWLLSRALLALKLV